jgi:hypothetical protein
VKRLLTSSEAAEYCGMGAARSRCIAPCGPNGCEQDSAGYAGTCVISTSGLTASRLTARVFPHLLTNGWSVWMPLIKIRGVKAYVSKGHVYAYHRKSGTRLSSTSIPFLSTGFASDQVHRADGEASEPSAVRPCPVYGGPMRAVIVDSHLAGAANVERFAHEHAGGATRGTC